MSYTKKNNDVPKAFVLLTLLFFLTLGLFAWLLHDVRDLSQKNAKVSKATARLSIENSKRISEIQASRIESCQTTYEGVRKVFRPFFPKDPKQKALIVKFNSVIDGLVAGCESQTKPQPSGEG